jgi:4-hydroxybenzoate polyprenyltransferase
MAWVFTASVRADPSYRRRYRLALLRNIKLTLEMIKWEHSIFALPFALVGAMLAANGWPKPWPLFWITVCMVAARSAAMAFNRLADEKIDAANPRTANRALPAGLLSRKFVVAFIVFWCAVFVAASFQLNPLAFYLSPVALATILLYSYTKRFTRFSHVFLGFALGVAPAAAWIAVRGALDIRILILTAAVTLWVGGFDILYACQDYEHDRRHGLFSIPQSVGIPKALLMARVLHLQVMILLAALVVVFNLGGWAIAGLAAVAILLAYEHTLVRANDLSRLNAAFFTMNGVIAVVFWAFVAADLLI